MAKGKRKRGKGKRHFWLTPDRLRELWRIAGEDGKRLELTFDGKPIESEAQLLDLGARVPRELERQLDSQIAHMQSKIDVAKRKSSDLRQQAKAADTRIANLKLLLKAKEEGVDALTDAEQHKLYEFLGPYQTEITELVDLILARKDANKPLATLQELADDLGWTLEKVREIVAEGRKVAMFTVEGDKLQLTESGALMEVARTWDEIDIPLEDLDTFLQAITQLKAEGIEPRHVAIADRVGWEEEYVRKVARSAQEHRLITINDGKTEGTLEDLGHRHADYTAATQGLLWIPSMTVRRFNELARQENLPQAMTEEEEEDLAAWGRHIVSKSHEERTEEGHHFVRAKVLLVCRPEPTATATWQDFSEMADEMTVKDLDEEAVPMRDEMVEKGRMLPNEDGSYRWADDAERRSFVDEFEAHRNFARPVMRDIDWPLVQFGMLVEGARPPDSLPQGDEGEMPIHAGSRSFEPIWRRAKEHWQRAERMAQDLEGLLVDAEQEVVKGEAEEESGDPTAFDGTARLWDVIDDHASARAVMAGDVLALMRRARVVTVGIDIAEGLPDWESYEECWDYAKDAGLPFPITFLDFTTPGGYCPKVMLPANRDGKVVEQVLSLRAALCWKQGGSPLTIMPFAWFEREDRSLGDWQDWRRYGDYDPSGTVTFGAEGPKEPLAHSRLPGPPGIAAPLVAVRHDHLIREGLVGWTNVTHEGLGHGTDITDEEINTAYALIATTTAARVLSVLYALDSTVNIDLADERPPRYARREVERALKKGKQAEIAKTVWIQPTRYDDRERRNGDGDETTKRHLSHAHWRRGHFAHYPLGTRIADRLAEEAPTKLVDHPVKGLCRKVYRKPTIVGRHDPDTGEEREPVAKSYVWKKQKRDGQPTPDA